MRNHIKFIFALQDNLIEITKSNLRNQDLSISFDSLIMFDPFFEINSDIYINKIDKRLINRLSLEKILTNQEVLKKLNSNTKVNYNKKRFGNTLIEKLFSELRSKNLLMNSYTLFQKC